MATMINPFISERQFFDSTKHRFFNLVRPIQTTQKKESDFLAYIITPVIDALILEPMFVIDVSIHLLNTIASLGRAAYLWTMYQQNTRYFIDYESMRELDAAYDHFVHSISAITAQSLNSVLSILALFTRPIASIVHAVSSDTINPDTYRSEAPPTYSYR